MQIVQMADGTQNDSLCTHSAFKHWIADTDVPCPFKHRRERTSVVGASPLLVRVGLGALLLGPGTTILIREESSNRVESALPHIWQGLSRICNLRHQSAFKPTGQETGQVHYQVCRSPPQLEEGTILVLLSSFASAEEQHKLPMATFGEESVDRPHVLWIILSVERLCN